MRKTLDMLGDLSKYLMGKTTLGILKLLKIALHNAEGILNANGGTM